MTILVDYEQVREIGRGGMGAVMLYRHRRTKAEVAVKVCTIALTESSLKRVKNEAEILENLDHENIIS